MEKNHLNAGLSGLDYFFHPRSIAIIGASSDFQKPSGRPVEALLKRGYKGRIFPVNPRYDEIAGLKCYPSVLAIPEEVDLVIIGVPAEMVRDILLQCVQKSVKAVIIFSSGFSEVGPEGEALQNEIAAIARKNNIRILGPNCFGLINLNNAVMASFANIVELEPVSPKVLGFVTQSGAFGAIIYTRALEQGVGFSCYVSVGNEADLEFSDVVAYLLGDPETKIIGGYLEGLKDGDKFRRVAEKALEMQKPLVIMKVGRSQAGSWAALSHTGHLVGNDRVYDAFFKQMGIIRIESLDELTSFAIVYASDRRPRGRNVAIISGSGGGGVVLTDKCEDVGLCVPEFMGETRTRLEQALPAFGSARNPVDLTGQLIVVPGMLLKCFKVVLEDDGIHMVIMNLGFSDHSDPEIVREVIEVYKSTDKPVILVGSVFPGSSQRAYELLDEVKEAGIPVIKDGIQAVQAMGKLVWYQEKAKRKAGGSSGVRDALCGPQVRDLLCQPGQLTEFQGKEILSRYGIPITREGLADSPEAAVELACRIGYPVALKIQSPQILHKTEAGGVRLNLRSDDEVRRAYVEIMNNARNYLPAAEIHGVLVQEMLGGGVEVIIGAAQDPVFGHVIMFGLGGIFVEALQDVSFRVIPVEREDAEEMIREIKGYRVLRGIRGKPPVNIDALAETILKVSRLVADHSDIIGEVDINPLVADENGARVVDALIVKK
jgi:acetyltransferase